jgi:hypothetical protein
MGLFWAGNGDIVTGDFGYYSRDYVDTGIGKHAHRRIRLGVGSRWGFIYLVPPLFAAGILLYHFIMFHTSGYKRD